MNPDIKKRVGLIDPTPSIFLLYFTLRGFHYYFPHRGLCSFLHVSHYCFPRKVLDTWLHGTDQVPHPVCNPAQHIFSLSPRERGCRLHSRIVSNEAALLQMPETTYAWKTTLPHHAWPSPGKLQEALFRTPLSVCIVPNPYPPLAKSLAITFGEVSIMILYKYCPLWYSEFSEHSILPKYQIIDTSETSLGRNDTSQAFICQLLGVSSRTIQDKKAVPKRKNPLIKFWRTSAKFLH